MEPHAPLTRRALLALGAGIVVRPIVAALPRQSDTIVIGVLLPPETSWTPSTRRAIAGIRFGAEEAAHAARLLRRSFALHERTGATAEDARALVADGATVVLAGLSSGGADATIAGAGASPGAPVIDVLGEEDGDPTCRDWLFHVAPGRARRGAAREAHAAAGDSSRGGSPGGDAPVTAWDASLERFGAAQLNARFRAHAGAEMDEAAWCGWTAVKLAAEAALRASPGTGVAEALRRGRFDAHKGRALTFAACVQRLQQPVYVGRAPRLVEAALALAALSALPLAGGTLGAQARASTPPRVVVSNEGSRDVSIVDLAARKVVRTIPVGERPRGIHATARGDRVLVALSDEQPNVQGGGDAIAEISLTTGRVVRRHRAGTDPEQFALLPPAETRLYATNEDAGTASAYDLRTGKARATLVVGIEPEGVAASRDGRWVYVTAETSNSVSVIDTRRDSVVTSFLVDVRPRAAAFSPDGARAWVTNEISGSLTVVDARRHEVTATIELEGGAGKPVGLVVSPDGRLVYVANGAAHAVSVVDAATLKVVARIPVGRRPWGITLSRDGRWLVTANGVSNDISLVDTSTRREVARVKVGQRPWGVDVLP